MNPTSLIIAEAALRHGIPFAIALVELLTKKGEPTREEWLAVFALAEKPYAAYTGRPAPSDIP